VELQDPPMTKISGGRTANADGTIDLTGLGIAGHLAPDGVNMFVEPGRFVLAAVFTVDPECTYTVSVGGHSVPIQIIGTIAIAVCPPVDTEVGTTATPTITCSMGTPVDIDGCILSVHAARVSTL